MIPGVYFGGRGELYRRIRKAGRKPVEVARMLGVAPSTLSRANEHQLKLGAVVMASLLKVLERIEHEGVSR